MRDVSDVLEAGMCAGCGLCAKSPNEMRIDAAGHMRPIQPVSQSAIDRACPGRQVVNHNHEALYDVTWGPLSSSQTGYAIDSEVHRQGSSGGIITALLQHLLSNCEVDAVIQVGAAKDEPIRNTTYIHDDPAAVLGNAGSRYAPSSPLAVIQDLLGNGNRYAFVGKPCDVAALRTFLRDSPQFEHQFPYLLSFFCAGVPSEHGTEAILKQMGVAREQLSSFRYRGDGWPGLTTASTRAGNNYSMTYNESWGTILNRHLQPRCKVCADGSGEAADVVCADAWFESQNGYPSFEENDGRSLILARTRVGQKLIDEALAAGMIVTEDYQIEKLRLIQPYQANRKQTALARKFALRLLGAGVPRFNGYKLWQASLHAGLAANFAAWAGTILRKLRGRMQ